MATKQNTEAAGREARIEILAPICQIAREADTETMSLLEDVLVEAHGREIVIDAWERAEQNARPTEQTDETDSEGDR